MNRSPNPAPKRARRPAAVVTASALCAALLWPSARAEPPAAAAAQNLLTLSASASAEVPRDLLSITFSTQREGADAAVVQAQLVQAVEAALAEARKQARPGQVEVSTGNFSLYPRPLPKGQPSTWQGIAEVRVEGRDIDAISRLVGRIQTLSVARVGYGLSREAREKAQAEVAAQAIARFRAQADIHAKSFGFDGVTLRQVEVNTQDISPPMPMYRAAAEMAMPAAAPLPVEAGKAQVSVSVSGTVQMK
jgi:predicted secreted protein